MREAITHDLVRIEPLGLESVAHARLRQAQRGELVRERARRREVWASVCIVAIVLEGAASCAIAAMAPWLTLVLALPMLVAWVDEQDD